MDGSSDASKPPLKLSLDLVSSFKPAKVFKEFVQPDCQVTALDYDDRGELCVTAADDETIQLYNCRSGKHVKTLYSKKYGVHLTRFTHRSSAIIYASTKEDGTSTKNHSQQTLCDTTRCMTTNTCNTSGATRIASYHWKCRPWTIRFYRQPSTTLCACGICAHPLHRVACVFRATRLLHTIHLALYLP